MKKTNRKKSYNTQLKKQLQKQVKIDNPAVILIKWTNSNGLACKTIQKKHLCFCGHQYSHHRLLSNKLLCDAPDCKCSSFQYVPNLFLNCICHHNILKHSKEDKHCTKCTSCLGFTTDWHCTCGQRYEEHLTKLEYVCPQGKKSHNNKSCVVLPIISKKNNLNGLSMQDRVIQNYSRVYRGQKENHRFQTNTDENQRPQEDLYSIYLHEKLKKVNERYFAKFEDKPEQFKVNTFQQDEKDGLNLYLKPHYYKKIPISKVICNNIINY